MSAVPAKRPVMLMILDGWGWREEAENNAVRLAHTPHFDRLWAASPHAFLKTSGLDVGLPPGQMGNSEVGHLNLGAGRVVMQDLPRINQAIADGSLRQALAASGLVDALKASGGACHLLGLVSPGGVHAHQDHAVALAHLLVEQDIPVRIHIFTDGRDTPPRSAAGYVRAFAAALPPQAVIASLTGRYFAMDRDHRWERVETAWRAMVLGEGPEFADAASAIEAAYAQGVTDEFIPASVIGSYGGMEDGDGLLSFNFRSDRIREILDAVLSAVRWLFPVAAAGAGEGGQHDFLQRRARCRDAGALRAADAGQRPRRDGGEGGSRADPHGGDGEVSARHLLLQRRRGDALSARGSVMVPSPKVATYDLQPDMSAPELTERAVEAIASGRYDLVVLNFANPDMVGHTGVLSAAIAAVETVDAGLGRIAEAVAQAGGALLVTADHGNCELMVDPETGAPHTAHTTFPVPVMVIGSEAKGLADGRLADIAPTLLALLAVPQPAEMTGTSLLR